MCHNSSACHIYVMWEELGQSLLYASAISNTVATTGTKRYLKGTVHFGLPISMTLGLVLFRVQCCY